MEQALYLFGQHFFGFLCADNLKALQNVRERLVKSCVYLFADFRRVSGGDGSERCDCRFRLTCSIARRTLRILLYRRSFLPRFRLCRRLSRHILCVLRRRLIRSGGRFGILRLFRGCAARACFALLFFLLQCVKRIAEQILP